MDIVYWLWEYGKVLLAYGLLMFVWPSVVFRSHLRGKRLLLRFGFCVTVQVILLYIVVTGLGLLHILNKWTVRIPFYAVFFWSLLRGKTLRADTLRDSEFWRLLKGTCGIKTYLYHKGIWLKNWLKQAFQKLWEKRKGRVAGDVLLAVVVIFGMIYFSYGGFYDHSYGFGDMYVHHSWIYGMTEGKIFSRGIYPAAMHCFIYALHTLFGVSVYSCMMFTAGIHVAVTLVSMYCLLRELFRWRYTPIFVLALFLTLDAPGTDEIYGMARLQWTLPQEFGMYAQFLCPCFLIRYLRSERKEGKIWDENLFLFMMALAVSAATHFYVTVMAFFLCVPIALAAVSRICKKKNMQGIVAAILCGVLLSAAPMAAAAAEGIPLQGSLRWGMNIANGSNSVEGRTQQAQEILQKQKAEELKKNGNKPQQIQDTESMTDTESTERVDQRKPVKRLTFKERLTAGAARARRNLYQYGYVKLYGRERADGILKMTFLAGGLWMAYRLILLFLEKKKKIGQNKKDLWTAIRF